MSKLMPVIVTVLLFAHHSHSSNKALEPLSAPSLGTHSLYKATTHTAAQDYTMETKFPNNGCFQLPHAEPEPSSERRAGTLSCTFGGLSAGIGAK